MLKRNKVGKIRCAFAKCDCGKDFIIKPKAEQEYVSCICGAVFDLAGKFHYRQMEEKSNVIDIALSERDRLISSVLSEVAM